MANIYDNNEFSLFEDDTDASILEKIIEPVSPASKRIEELKKSYKQAVDSSNSNTFKSNIEENKIVEEASENKNIKNIFANTDGPKDYDKYTKIYPPYFNMMDENSSNNKEIQPDLSKNDSDANKKEKNDNKKKDKSTNPKKSSKKGLKVFGVVFLVLFIIILLGIFLDQTVFRKELFDKTNSLFTNTKYFGELTISGEIIDKKSILLESGFNSQFYINSIKKLKKDNNNKGLILILDSPGGSAYTSNQILKELKSYHETKPVVVVMGSIAASGAYLISSEADYIVADESTLTGSVGVTLGTQFDISEFLSKNGIKTNAITSGANKNMGSIFSSMSSVQKNILQEIVDDEYQRFVGQIEEGRNINAKKIQNALDGRIMTAKSALAYKLIDKIGTKSDALDFLKKKAFVTKITVSEIKSKSVGFFDFIFSIFDTDSSKLENKNVDLNSFANVYNILKDKKNSLLMMLYEGS